MSFKSVLEKCPLIAGGHLFGAHVKQGNKYFDNGKSYFVNHATAPLDFDKAWTRLGNLQQAAQNLASTNPGAEQRIDGIDSRASYKLRKVNASDEDYVAFAFTDGSLVGLSDRGTRYYWVYFVVTKNLDKGGRHQWVTAYPGAEPPNA